MVTIFDKHIGYLVIFIFNYKFKCQVLTGKIIKCKNEDFNNGLLNKFKLLNHYINYFI